MRHRPQNRTPRAALATLALVGSLALTGCGDPGSSADDTPPETGTPTASPTSTPTASPTGTPTDERLPALFSESAAGGTTGAPAVRLEDRAAVDRLTDGLDGPRGAVLAREVRTAWASADVDGAGGAVLAGAVVHVGCTPPEEVTVTVESDRIEVVPVFTGGKDSDVTCLVPVTTVALVEVPTGA